MIRLGKQRFGEPERIRAVHPADSGEEELVGPRKGFMTTERFDTAHAHGQREKLGTVRRYPGPGTIQTKTPAETVIFKHLKKAEKGWARTMWTSYQFHNPSFCPARDGTGLMEAAEGGQKLGNGVIGITNHWLHERGLRGQDKVGLYETLQFPFLLSGWGSRSGVGGVAARQDMGLYRHEGSGPRTTQQLGSLRLHGSYSRKPDLGICVGGNWTNFWNATGLSWNGPGVEGR